MSACAVCPTQATFFAYLQKGTKSRNVGLPAARAFTGRPRVVVVVVAVDVVAAVVVVVIVAVVVVLDIALQGCL